MSSCDVIRDLLPVYADGLTSEASNRLISEHVQQCPHCRDLMEQMCAPMEPEPVDPVQAYLDAMRARKKRKRRRIVIALVLAGLLCLTGYWIYMETHFVGETPVVVSTDPEKILAQMPALALTQAEKDLAGRIQEIPAFREAMGTETPQEIPLDPVEDAIAPVLPEDASVIEICVIQHSIYIDFWHDGFRVILLYLDSDASGSVDAIRKNIGVPKSPDDPGARTVYSLEYVCALNKTWYEKAVAKHIWFDFLHIPAYIMRIDQRQTP